MRDPPLILVVDDVPDNVDILQMRLEAQNYEVATAVDGLDALEKIRELLPDLVLLDVMMPKLDGIETVKQLKADASLPFIPVILVTAKADASDAADQGVARHGSAAGGGACRLEQNVGRTRGGTARRTRKGRTAQAVS